MSVASEGAWERKRARARTGIQRAALRLFREQGFAATTVEQVAAAADVAPSTVFRHFPTKQDLLALDGHFSLLDPLTEAFEALPENLSPLQAIRQAVVEALTRLSPDDRTARVERDLLLLTVPEVWSANLALMHKGMDTIAALVARRMRRSADDPEVRDITRAASGVAIGVLLDHARAPEEDPIAALDRAFALLEEGSFR
jgi:AcrR family transcriptional regulator